MDEDDFFSLDQYVNQQHNYDDSMLDIFDEDDCTPMADVGYDGW